MTASNTDLQALIARLKAGENVLEEVLLEIERQVLAFREQLRAIRGDLSEPRSG